MGFRLTIEKSVHFSIRVFLVIACSGSWAASIRSQSVPCEVLLQSTVFPPSYESIEYAGIQFQVTKLESKRYFEPKPHAKLSPTYDPQSQFAKDLDTTWSLQKFKFKRDPQFIAPIAMKDVFSRPNGLRILDLPIKMKGSNEYRVPEELAQFAEVIQKVIDHEHAMMSEEKLEKYYAYVTIDQGWVDPGTTQRKPGCHVDGFQGSRIHDKTSINHSYVVSDSTPTVFYSQSFDFDHLSDETHDFFKEMDRLADDSFAIRPEPYQVALMDAYTVHRADVVSQAGYRTFLRISYDVKEFDRLGNTVNPHFDYEWNMVARDVHSTLTEYKPLEQCRRCGACPRGRALQEQSTGSPGLHQIEIPNAEDE